MIKQNFTIARTLIFIVIISNFISCEIKEIKNEEFDAKSIEKYEISKAFQFNISKDFQPRADDSQEQIEIDKFREAYNAEADPEFKMNKSNVVFIKSNRNNESDLKIMVKHEVSDNDEFPKYDTKIKNSELEMLDTMFKSITKDANRAVKGNIEENISQWSKVEYNENSKGNFYIKLNYTSESMDTEYVTQTFIFNNTNEKVYINAFCQKPCEEDFFDQVEMVVQSFSFNQLK